MTCQNAWISCISYNTDRYLEYRLNELYDCHKIEFWYFINHRAEEDELKTHKHVLIKTNGRFDTMDLEKSSIEPDTNNELPLKCIGFRKLIDKDEVRNGKFLYDKHDVKYLKSIGESRKYHYTWEDFHTSDKLTFDYYVSIIQIPKSTIQEINESFDRGEGAYSLIKSGKVPLTQINFLTAFRNLRIEEQEATIRNNKINKLFVCKICGEIKDLSEAFDTPQERLDKHYPIATCYKCHCKEMESR